MKAEEIKATVTKTANDAELLELAIERNATHGLQLSQEDKRTIARNIYNITPEKDRDQKKKRLATILSVSERTVRDWLSRTVKEAKDRRDAKIEELWFACWTFDEIAKECGCSATVVKEVVSSEKFSKTIPTKPAAEHATDFEPPLYNVWKQQEKTAGSNHFGNSEVRWLDNLLYLYTKPLNIVVDPFAGGGSTIDLCRKRFRRYWVGDRLPVVEREMEIRRQDRGDGGVLDGPGERSSTAGSGDPGPGRRLTSSGAELRGRLPIGGKAEALPLDDQHRGHLDLDGQRHGDGRPSCWPVSLFSPPVAPG